MRNPSNHDSKLHGFLQCKVLMSWRWTVTGRSAVTAPGDGIQTVTRKETVEEHDLCFLSKLNPVEDETTPGCDVRTRGTNSTNKGVIVQLAENECEILVCVPLTRQRKQTSMARDFDTTQMHWTSQGRKPTQPSRQVHRNMKTKGVDDESQQGRRTLKFKCTRAHTPQGYVHLCVRANLCVLVRVEHPVFARQRTRTVQLARPHAPHPPSSVLSHCTLQSVFSALLGGGRWKAEVRSLVCDCAFTNVRATLHYAGHAYECTRAHTPHDSVHLCERVHCAVWSTFFLCAG